MSLPQYPLPLETNPTSAGLRVQSFTQDQARATMCSVASNNKHGMPRKMRVLHVEDHWVNQITITPFHGPRCTLQGLETSSTTQSISVGTHWKILSFLYKKKKFNFAAHHRIDRNICLSSFLSDKPWYPVTAQPWGSLLDFSWVRQGCEQNLWWSAWWIWPSMCGQLSFPAHGKFSINLTPMLLGWYRKKH